MSRRRFERLKAVTAVVGKRRALGVASVLLAAAAFCVWTDKPGLRARYISHLDERPVLVRTDDRMTLDRWFAGAIFHYQRIFTVEWRGWLEVERGGPHAIRLTSSGPVRLAIDGEEVLAEGGERRRTLVRVRLEPGLHRLAIRFDHSGPEIAFAAELREPRSEWAELPIHRLYDRRPGPLRRLIRDLLGGANPVARKLVASVFLLAALLAAWRAAEGARRWTAVERLAALTRDPRRRRWLLATALVLLFVVAAFGILPRTGSPFGWDDVRYLDIAAFDKSVPWVLNRYAHVYLLDFFIWLARGDAFLGARAFWSVQFGLIVCALAVSAAALGPRLQLATFGVSLLLLFSQPLYFTRAGASVPDTTVGTLVMVAVALYLHRWRRGPTPFEWQILLIGALTVWAFKSKELGIILLWLPVLFVFEGGELDLRGCARRLGFWTGGAVAGLALLMAVDTVYFGDPLYGLRPQHFEEVNRLNFADDPQQRRENEGWIDVLTQGRSPVATNNPRMRYMALLVLGAALLAGWKQRALELRLLHFLPVLYVLMLMVIHIRATYVFLPRYLYPILPVSCFLGAAAFHYLGLDDLEWREVGSPRFFVPALVLGFLVVAIVVPYDTHWIPAEYFLPAGWLTAVDWTSLDVFVRLVAAPALVLTLVLALALFQRHRPTRLLLAATLAALFLGQPFFRTVWELRIRRAWQRGETHLHGLRVLGDQIPAESGTWVQVDATLTGRHKMFGVAATCERVVAVYLRRRDLKISCWPAVFPGQDVAFLSRESYRAWLESWPELEGTATFSPAGELVLVRPKQAGEPPAFYSQPADSS